ncbi:leucine-rich repeat protein, partial [Ruminococcaceae bacterium OttesenSCG-928-D13]|nr:leucine-rich repeat protein [Ruminococcaceae bacterium OttesenSCG-928-D13]
MKRAMQRILPLLLAAVMLFSVMPTPITAADGAPLPGDEQSGELELSPEGDGAPASITVAMLDALDEAVLFQSFEAGEIATQAQVTLPDALTGQDESGEALAIEGLEWTCTGRADDPDAPAAFDPQTPGAYTFTATLPQGYTLAEGVALPDITVTVRAQEAAVTAQDMYDVVFVVYGESTNPIPNATVTILRDGTKVQSGKTDEYGTARFALPEGEYTAEVAEVAFKGKYYAATQVDFSVPIPEDLWIGLNTLPTFTDGAFRYQVTSASLQQAEVIGLAGPAPANGLNIPATASDGTNTYSVTSIGDRAFEATGISGTLTIPASVTTIGSNAFFCCAGITGLQLPATGNLTVIGNEAFWGSGISGTLTIPASVTVIGDSAFRNTGLSGTLTIPSSVTVIGDSAFEGTGLSGTLTIPASVTTIGHMAFYRCGGITGLSLPATGSLTIGGSAFEGTGLSGTLTIP